MLHASARAAAPISHASSTISVQGVGSALIVESHVRWGRFRRAEGGVLMLGFQFQVPRA